MGNPNVYVIQQANPRHWTPDLAPAAKFGAVHFIFDADERPYASTFEAMDKIADRLQDFDPATDYICWSNAGDPAGMWLIMAYLGRHHPCFRVLYWSRGKGRDGNMTNENGYYFPIEIDQLPF